MAHFAEAKDYARWTLPHSAFHRGLTAPAGARVNALLQQLSDHFERYRRVHIARSPKAWLTAGHREILDACKAGDRELSARLLAEHLSRDRVRRDGAARARLRRRAAAPDARGRRCPPKRRRVELTTGRVRGRDGAYLGIPYARRRSASWAPPAPVAPGRASSTRAFGPPRAAAAPRRSPTFAHGPDRRRATRTACTSTCGRRRGDGPLAGARVGDRRRLDDRLDRLADLRRRARSPTRRERRGRHVHATGSARSAGCRRRTAGLLDHVAALEWVRDAHRARSAATRARDASAASRRAPRTSPTCSSRPAAEGLFTRAILHSPPLPEAAQRPRARRARWARRARRARRPRRARPADVVAAPRGAARARASGAARAARRWPTLDPATLPVAPLDAPGRAPRHPGPRRHHARRGDVPAAHGRPRRARRAGRARSPRELFAEPTRALGARARRGAAGASTASGSTTRRPTRGSARCTRSTCRCCSARSATARSPATTSPTTTPPAPSPSGCSTTGPASSTATTPAGPGSAARHRLTYLRGHGTQRHIGAGGILVSSTRCGVLVLTPARLLSVVAGMAGPGEQSRRSRHGGRWLGRSRASSWCEHGLDLGAL